MSHNWKVAAEKLVILFLLGKYGIREQWQFCCLKKQHMCLRKVSKKVILPTASSQISFFGIWIWILEADLHWIYYSYCASWTLLYPFASLLFNKKLKQQDILIISTMNSNLCSNSSTLLIHYLTGYLGFLNTYTDAHFSVAEELYLQYSFFNLKTV